jgi:hypothetical protein
MDSKHSEWIEEYKANNRVREGCEHATELMCKAFPELKRVAGFVLMDVEGMNKEMIESCLPSPNMSLFDRRLVWERPPGPVQHWWCVDPDGLIVDPTFSQFLASPKLLYVAYSEELHGPKPEGKCLDCGELIFGREDSVCSDICYKRFSEHLKEEKRTINDS